MNNSPIGFYDSGIGGLHLLKAAVKEFPNENFIYYGDNSNAPYGDKPREILNLYSYDAIKTLIDKGAKCVVIACNTVSTNCMSFLTKLFTVKLIPTLPPIESMENICKPSLLLCTPSTAKSVFVSKYSGLITVFPLHRLASEIERNVFNIDKVDLESHLLNCSRNYQKVILGCTHYKFLYKKFQKCFPESEITDNNMEIIENLKKYLISSGCYADDKLRGNVEFINDVFSYNENVFYNIL